METIEKTEFTILFSLMSLRLPALFLFLAGSGISAGLNAAPAPGSKTELRCSAADRLVSSYPLKPDLSSPESAYAAMNRLAAAGDLKLWAAFSAPSLAADISGRTGPARPLSDSEAKPFLEARILQVCFFGESLAAVTAGLAGENSRKIDRRDLEFHNGRWLNAGNSRFDTLEQAREDYARVLSSRIKPPPLLPPGDPETYLWSFVKYLKLYGQNPRALALNAARDNDLLIIGEIHHRPAYWKWNSELIADEKFAGLVGTIFLELPSNDQPLADAFLANDRMDLAPVLGILRDFLWTGWPDKAMLDFFSAVWLANHRNPPSRRYRIVLADMPRPWKMIVDKASLRSLDTEDRDFLMAGNILAHRGLRGDNRHGLFITGFAHAMKNLRLPVGDIPYRSAGWYLSSRGDLKVYAILQHSPVMPNFGEAEGRACLGLFDAAFRALGDKPVAFPLAGGPFGGQPFDIWRDSPHRGLYRDAFDAYLYLTPLEGEAMSPLIPGFYTDDFVKELDRRYRVLNGPKTGLVKGLGLARADGSSFTAWMARSWGQPRDWGAGLGPDDAWRYGGAWRGRYSRQAYELALRDPRIIRREALRLFKAVGSINPKFPDTLKDVNYTVDHYFDLWVEWVARNIIPNPIAAVDLGAVIKDKDGRPAIDYVLTLKDGKKLQGTLPFEYDPQHQVWNGVKGLDWHLKAGGMEGPEEPKR